MALSLFAAESIVGDYLDGRILPAALHDSVVRMAEARLRDGSMPVLNETMCRDIDAGATTPPPWSIESVVKAAQARSRELRTIPEAL
ncbi:hypothetical protein QTH89_13870 [Variovorax sp. J22G21]|uniref:hypothetical protein n=1 Tax=Variovorax fucosicus TaxID=3053517 RepID=UPI002576A5EA|nr:MULTISPECIES: hypothetical protein [unclassified Variovorax]MDM0037508.1 hypothetical protein [Variovorax sp. J22R193]MDM0062284.1 hypothetical protein [Variovorax sp. J22G21]